MSKIFITNKQRNLIINSEFVKNKFEAIYLLLKRKDVIRYQEIKDYPELNNIEAYYDDLINNCLYEWEFIKTNDLGENYKKQSRVCDLCGYKPLKIVNEIKNKVNRKNLIVGTECAKEFGEVVLEMVKHAQKSLERAEKRRFIEEKIPGIRKYIESSKDYISRLDIIVSDQLERKWNVAFNLLEKAYDDFINSKSKDSQKIIDLWEEKNAVIREIEEFIMKNKDTPFIANKKVYNWLLSNKKFDVIQMIRENKGVVGWSTAHRIEELDFMKFVLEKLKKYFADIGIEIMSISPPKNYVNMRFRKRNKYIDASVKYKDLILNHGGFIFEKEYDDSFLDVFKSVFIQDQLSQEKIIDLSRKSSFIKKQVFFEDNQAIFLNENRYCLINLKDLINTLKDLYFEKWHSKEEVDAIFKRVIIKRMTEQEYERFMDIRKEKEYFNKRVKD